MGRQEKKKRIQPVACGKCHRRHNLRAKVYPASAESAPFVPSNRQEGVPCNSLSPTQECRDMNYFLSQGFFQLISPYYGVSLSPRTRCQRLPWRYSSPLIRKLETPNYLSSRLGRCFLVLTIGRFISTYDTWRAPTRYCLSLIRSGTPRDEESFSLQFASRTWILPLCSCR